MLGAATDNCPAALNPAVAAADTNGNGVIDQSELVASRDQWQAGSLPRPDMDAITQAWVYQCSIPSGTDTTPPQAGGGAVAGALPGGVGKPQHVDVPGLTINPAIFNDVNGDGKFTKDDCALLLSDLNNNAVATGLQYDFNGDSTVGSADVKACEELAAKIPGAAPLTGAAQGMNLSVERVTRAGGDVRALTTEPAKLAEAGLSCALDWGDGTEKARVTPQATRHETRHSYAATGNYTVTYECGRPNGDILTRTAGISVDVNGPDQAAAGHALTVLFVPFNYTDPAAAAADVNRAAGWIKQTTPLNEFTDASVPTIIAPPSQCAPGPDHRICDDAVMSAWSASADKGRIDLAVGMCAPGTCLLFLQQSPGNCNVSSGVTYGLGRRVSIMDMFACQGADGTRIDGERTLIHEIGHAWGLDHVRACQMPETASVCAANPASAECKELTATFDDGVNARDAQAPNSERDYMTYCPTAVDHYGPLGLAHIRSVLFTSGLPRSRYLPSP